VPIPAEVYFCEIRERIGFSSLFLSGRLYFFVENKERICFK